MHEANIIPHLHNVSDDTGLPSMECDIMSKLSQYTLREYKRILDIIEEEKEEREQIIRENNKELQRLRMLGYIK